MWDKVHQGPVQSNHVRRPVLGAAQPQKRGLEQCRPMRCNRMKQHPSKGLVPMPISHCLYAGAGGRLAHTHQLPWGKA
jgi:hypothetical protein